MRGRPSRARGPVLLAGATFLTFVGAVGCERTWDLPGQPDGGWSGGSGGRGAGSGGTGGATGSPSGGSGGLSGWAGQGGGGGPFPPGSGGNFGGLCRITPSIDVADLIFLVGRNQSMNSPFGDRTRMEGVATSIRRVVGANPVGVNFGYQDFAAANSCTGSNTCCSMTGQPVYPSMNNLLFIDAALGCDQGPSASSNPCTAMSDGRPLESALKVLGTTLNDGPLRERYVILLIDGPPTCSDQSGNACDRATLQLSILANNNSNVKPFVVVALGPDAPNDPCLNKLAAYGGAPQMSTPLGASDTDALTKLLTGIVDKAAQSSCTINLLYSCPMIDTNQLSLVVDGDPIKRDTTLKDGWDLSSPAQIRVYGPSCRKVQAAQKSTIKVFVASNGPP